jgi:pyruvate/2-oxoglutarate dehydrogenase complex dihydrolipoamide dehydrogenase (E3) component
MAARSVDVIVIGSGQGGNPLAVALAKRGKRVVLFERDKIGGSCVNYGCTPSKAFLAAAHKAGRARRAADLGVQATVDVDFPFVMNRARKISTSFRDESAKRLRDTGVKIVHAEAAFTGERVVRGGELEVTAPLVVLDTGTTATIPSIAGLDGTPFLTNETFFAQTELPKSFLVIGGGYIGLELGQGMARVGSRVHIVQDGERVLDREDAKVSEALQASLKKDGVHVHLSAKPSRVAFENNAFSVELDGGETLQAERLLVATGRTPNTGALNAAACGIALDDRGYVKIDAQFRTSCEGVYAIGDVSGQPAFTHVSWEDHRRLLSILDGGDRTRDDRVLGYAVFTEPQVGRAGLTFEQAQEKGMKARCEELPAGDVARAIEWGDECGFYRMVVDADSGTILGATLVGYEAAELVHVFIALMESGATWHTLEQAMFIHPTYSEGLPTLARKFA